MSLYAIGPGRQLIEVTTDAVLFNTARHIQGLATEKLNWQLVHAKFAGLTFNPPAT